jgi:hypothetical protein
VLHAPPPTLGAGEHSVKPVRVQVANHPRLMRELVLATIADQPDIELVGEIRNESDLVNIVARVYHMSHHDIPSTRCNVFLPLCDFLLGNGRLPRASHSLKQRGWKRRLSQHPAEAGIYLVALLPPGTNAVAVPRTADQRGISALPLSSRYLKQPMRVDLIPGYGGANARRIHDGIGKLRLGV